MNEANPNLTMADVCDLLNSINNVLKATQFSRRDIRLKLMGTSLDTHWEWPWIRRNSKRSFCWEARKTFGTASGVVRRAIGRAERRWLSWPSRRVNLHVQRVSGFAPSHWTSSQRRCETPARIGKSRRPKKCTRKSGNQVKFP